MGFLSQLVRLPFSLNQNRVGPVTMRYVEMVVPRAAAFDSYSVMYVVIQTS